MKQSYMTSCTPYIEKMRCDRIATYHGSKYRKPYYECRAKLLSHDNYIGNLKVSTDVRTCVLAFHLISNQRATQIDQRAKIKIVRRSLQNRCKRKNSKKERFGPWSKCLSSDCQSLNAIEVRRRFCAICGFFNYNRWLLNGAGALY